MHESSELFTFPWNVGLGFWRGFGEVKPIVTSDSQWTVPPPPPVGLALVDDSPGRSVVKSGRVIPPPPVLVEGLGDGDFVPVV
jgi:hypothetical protein